MDIIVAGCGKVGTRLVEDLAIEGHNVTIIDKDRKVVERMLEAYDIQGVIGSGSDIDVLLEARIDHCDMFIALTPMDEANIIAAVTAKRLGAAYTVARVRKPEYFHHWDFMRDSLGVSMMINPEREAAKSIDNVLSFPSAIEIEEFSSHRADMIQVKIPKGSPLIGAKLKDLTLPVTLCSVLREGEAFIPKGDYEIQEGDSLYITGPKKDLENFCKKADIYKNAINSILIIGAGRITYYLLKLLPKRYDIKVIEISKDVCESISAEFAHVVVVNADGTDPDILKEEGLHRYDVCVMLTGVDEENILLSLYANQKKVGKIITKVNRQPLLNVVSGQGLQTIITPKVLAANLITQIIRAKSNTKGSNIKTFHRIAEDKVEVMEFVVSENSKLIHVPLKDLDIKEKVIFAYIVRGTQVIFPKGNDEIRPHDRVIIATTIPFIEDLDEVLNMEVNNE